MSSLPDPLERGLTLLRCLAYEPALGGILFVDLDPALLVPLARWLAGGSALGTTAPHVVTLGASASEDDLWSGQAPRFSRDAADTSPRGLLRWEPTDHAPVVVVPDLARAGLATVRAAIAMIGSDIHPHDPGRTSGRTRWIAGCARDDAQRLSAHLLDRFPVRVDGAPMSAEWVSRANLVEINDPEGEAPALASVLGIPAVTGVPTRRPVPADGVAARIVALTGTVTSRRRDLALGRVARALATHASAPEFTVQDVDLAAALMGPASAEPPPPVPEPTVVHHPPGAEQGDEPGKDLVLGSDPTGDTTVGPHVAAEGTGARREAAEALGPEAPSLYPEDQAMHLPPASSLRLPGQNRLLARRLRGQAIGVMPFRGDVRDLAVVATLLEAAKYQSVRRANRKESGRRLLISPVDLRVRRRQPESGRLFVVVLDHTCPRGEGWAQVVAPYFRWAFQEGARVCLIEFGHRDSAHELSATRTRAESLFDPRVLAAFEREPGRASPLAHALDLAVHELRRFLRRGRAATDEAVVVVATDGRGNVPLAASLSGRLSGPVGRDGVTDGLPLAIAIGALHRTTTVVVTPDVHQQRHLPVELAEAMDATVAVVPDEEDLTP
ncbi:hypothetical protein AB0M43_36820 [Longispora sp. NPDC051575]|uniref:hypothetical protein n=1 Tax=Longispora sp. NPDC051575 TaxID=3154943 RepID=UPI00343DC970